MSIIHNRNSAGVAIILIILLSVSGSCRCPVCLCVLKASYLTMYTPYVPALSLRCPRCFCFPRNMPRCLALLGGSCNTTKALLREISTGPRPRHLTMSSGRCQSYRKHCR